MRVLLSELFRGILFGLQHLRVAMKGVEFQIRCSCIKFEFLAVLFLCLLSFVSVPQSPPPLSFSPSLPRHRSGTSCSHRMLTKAVKPCFTTQPHPPPHDGVFLQFRHVTKAHCSIQCLHVHVVMSDVFCTYSTIYISIT